MNTVQVASVDEVGQLVETYGGQIVVEKMAIPGIGYQVYCRDSEGNLFGLHESDTEAE